MGAVFLFFFCIIITIILFKGAFCLSERDNELAVIIFVFIAIIMTLITIIVGLNLLSWTVTKLNEESSIAYNKSKQIMYSEMIEKYENLAIKDVTASEQHMNLYKEILDFNYEIDCVERNGHQWWTEGVLWDPSYVGVDKVQIKIN